ncbi:4-hydroxy-3-methylbut-2-en-1-yl diphosphate synthase chloroplastic [Phtheirospermum japonicum]|uniref:Large ribosomal subunit protein uL4c n=1 Tax=Phtheirospermum japonicum TaxID=374723 RepID=A0A830CMR5_9LAMI|nr:4-hydroxy-3-methylbut-2-en-1-yl diphosphate synthase chloroplastic [Phtheirospermum japonicum]
MATGAVSAPFIGVKSRHHKGIAKSSDFIRVSDLQRVKFRRTKIGVAIRNYSPNPNPAGSETVELEPASSDGSPLLVPRQKYCESIHKTIRRKTRTVMVGNVALGSEHPIRIQTMTTTDTKDVAATVEQVMRIADQGADIVRITVQGKKEADACFDIKNTLVQKNYNIPLVADIHFAPPVALRVSECFDKIRVNPGNFADRRAQFEKLEYTEDDYQKELEHIEQVESAFEYARICRKLDFHNFVFSMKASNPVIMVQAYRLLVAEMNVLEWDYPLHLGVTEAGEGEDGRMKSAIGIGTLLMDGLGDTIRVSLTEPPEEEIDPCRRLAKLGTTAAELQKGVVPFEEKNRRYFDFQRRTGQLPLQKEGEEVDYRGVLHRDGSVLMSVSLDQLKAPELLYKSLAAKLIVGMPFKDLATVDSILLRELPAEDDKDALTKPLPNALVMVTLNELSTGAHKLLPEGTRLVVSVRGDEPYDELKILKTTDAVMILHDLPYSEDKISRVHAARRIFEYLSENSLDFPVIHHIQFPKQIHRDDLVIGAGTNAGALLVDGLGDGILLEAPDQDFDFLRNTSFNLLQGCRMRNTKTEYVSCPSCGRTLFDLQEISAEIREKTSHLPGVSIAIMGCIVNGPGEMADADFGYVGGAPGKIDLYVGKRIVCLFRAISSPRAIFTINVSCVDSFDQSYGAQTVVKRGIAMEHATDALIQLIKDHGRWVDPPAQEITFFPLSNSLLQQWQLTASPSSISFFSSSIFLSNSTPSRTKLHFFKPQTIPRASTAIHAELTTLPVLSFEGTQVGSASLNLKSAPSETARAVVHRGLTTDLTNRRRGTASTLTRAEVRGGGQKPYPQKKTGRARRGSQRTPLRPGGGVIFGPKPKDWSVKINKKEKRLAISTAIASAAESAVVIEDFDDKFEKPKTKEFIAMMERLGLDPKQKSMFLMTEVSDNVKLSSRNIGTLKMLTPRTLNLFDILDSQNLVLTKGAVEFLNERYGFSSEDDDEMDELEEAGEG